MSNERSFKKAPPKRPRWIQQIARDAAVPARSVRFGAGLVGFVNEKTLVAWPGMETLAQACATSVRTLQRSWQPLVACGHLEVLPRTGRTNLFRIVLAVEDADADSVLGGDSPVIPFMPLGVTDFAKGDDSFGQKGRQPCHPNLVEPYKEPSAAGAAVDETAAPAAARWWESDPAWTTVAASLDRLGQAYLSMCTRESDAVLVAPWPRVIHALKQRRAVMEAARGGAVELRCAANDADDDAA